MKLTEKQIAALQGICDSDYQDGANPVGNGVWSWSANPWEGTPQATSFGGVVASLEKAGLCGTQQDRNLINGRWRTEHVIWITEAGMKALNEAKAGR